MLIPVNSGADISIALLRLASFKSNDLVMEKRELELTESNLHPNKKIKEFMYMIPDTHSMN